jgi:hypothetical protein
MKNTKGILLVALIVVILFAFNGCGDDGDDGKSHLNEHDFAQNPSLVAIPDHIVIINLEHPDATDVHEHDSHVSGIDRIPLHFFEDVSHEFIVEYKEEGDAYFVVLLDEEGKEILRVDRGNTTVTENITAGTYTLEIHHGGGINGAYTLFVRPGSTYTGGDCPGCDLSYAYLSHANLNGADLSGTDLSYAYLESAYLESANLSHANLNGADLRLANLSGANLSGADLSYAYLESACLESANLSHANLNGADLSGANLDGANLSGATWSVNTTQKFLAGSQYLMPGDSEWVTVDILESYLKFGRSSSVSTTGTISSYIVGVNGDTAMLSGTFKHTGPLKDGTLILCTATEIFNRPGEPQKTFTFNNTHVPVKSWYYHYVFPAEVDSGPKTIDGDLPTVNSGNIEMHFYFTEPS